MGLLNKYIIDNKISKYVMLEYTFQIIRRRVFNKMELFLRYNFKKLDKQKKENINLLFNRIDINEFAKDLNTTTIFSDLILYALQCNDLFKSSKILDKNISKNVNLNYEFIRQVNLLEAQNVYNVLYYLQQNNFSCDIKNENI